MTDTTALLRQAARVAREEPDARWHPVADWLDAAVARLEATVHPSWHDVVEPHSVAVARALVEQEPLRADAEHPVDLEAEIERLRGDLDVAMSFAWIVGGELVRVTRLSDAPDGWAVDVEDQTVAVDLDRTQALARAREIAGDA
ncbi:hypothetical protein [Marinitenerispora sediminis]|uniref:Uncharacterized protein n=1 Tax=Marinitenerispora sediminis TaxID=1931232 RepID=A0A368T6N9_9ACTN|nr:hypothetical protein [Marinitenerispora sediminis]RCV53490.1 hypothetical protein DEF23_17580 [Marinitenerispora sediminis]RCV59318.1 hypothetical protein DEF24_10120 [Marinitenerispora sediminis]